MRLYELRSQMPSGSVRSFYGSDVSAKSARATSVKDGIPRKYHEILSHEIPTNKLGLIEWLNSNAGRVGPVNGEVEAAGA